MDDKVARVVIRKVSAHGAMVQFSDVRSGHPLMIRLSIAREREELTVFST